MWLLGVVARNFYARRARHARHLPTRQPRSSTESLERMRQITLACVSRRVQICWTDLPSIVPGPRR